MTGRLRPKWGGGLKGLGLGALGRKVIGGRTWGGALM